MLNSEQFDLFVINTASAKIQEFQDIFYRIEQKNIPTILYLPPNSEWSSFIRNYKKAIIIGGDVGQSGTLEGKILADAWNTNKETMDKNKDNIMQYVMLQGTSNDGATIARTQYSIKVINEAGIKAQQLLSTTCNWDKECAKNTIELAFLQYGNKIEAIISNNDEMAIGAIEALQKYGYNKGDKSKYIPVVGVDGMAEAQELVKQGSMAGTVLQDPYANADAIYKIGINMACANNPLDGTNYKFDETRNSIRIPYISILNNNNQVGSGTQ